MPLLITLFTLFSLFAFIFIGCFFSLSSRDAAFFLRRDCRFRYFTPIFFDISPNRFLHASSFFLACFRFAMPLINRLASFRRFFASFHASLTLRQPFTPYFSSALIFSLRYAACSRQPRFLFARH